MNYRINLITAFLASLLILWSCSTEDIDPDLYFNDFCEINISCFISDYVDTATSAKELWAGYKISNYMTNENFIGHCWNFNTDTLPTIESIIRKEEYTPGKWDLTLINYDFIYAFYRTPFRTGIPLTENDTLITVRSFIMFNDSLIRYSPPLIVENPLQYASK
jgi:hypothetical protein